MGKHSRAQEVPTASTATPWHCLSREQLLNTLDTDARGLSAPEVESRRARYGENRLPAPPRRGPLKRLLSQFNNMLIHVLIAAGLITLALGQWLDAGVIFAVVVVNALIGFVQEGRAEQAMDSIRKMMSTRTRVHRDGQRLELDATELVPGDLIALESGDRVPADARVLTLKGLRTDESSLTGESVPVDKDTTPVAQQTPLGDRLAMVWSGTLVVAGRAEALVVATGDHTELGRISSAAEHTPPLATPLLKRIEQFGRQLTVIILVLAAITFTVGTQIQSETAVDMFFAAVGLAVAAIPEGLPAIITITLALGVQAMAHRNAIIRRLPAVEALGSVTVICSDKTGTLTRNEMTVRSIATRTGQAQVSGAGYALDGAVEGLDNSPRQQDQALLQLLQAGLLCNDSHIQQVDNGIRISGDPMEAALLVVAAKGGLDGKALRHHWQRVDHIPFESENRYMATLDHDPQGRGRILVKGAPERILEMCRQAMDASGQTAPLDPAYWQDLVDSFARQGRRTLAFAMKAQDQGQASLQQADAEQGLVLLGLVALEDPPRDEAIAAVRHCHDAGIRVKMITGDHLGTALAIGRQLGIGDGSNGMTGKDFDTLSPAQISKVAQQTDVFARFSPDNKLTLVKALQQAREVVAMTGDGVNDAPALRRADVGVAMGKSGTEAAREAAEIVLADDNFASIAGAVKTGRAIYDNIRKSLLFILPTNGGQALLILAAVMAGLALPVTPVQILWVNMVTAVTLALALTMEPAEPGIMQRPPRSPQEGIFTPFLVWRVLLVSTLVLAATFWIFSYHQQSGFTLEQARTAAVNTVIAAQVFYLMNCRHLLLPVFSRAGLLGNPWVPGAIGLILLLQSGFSYLPFMHHLFGTAALPANSWLLIIMVTLPLLFIVELEKWLLRRFSPRPQRPSSARESVQGG